MFQDPCFPGSRFFKVRVQVFQGPGPGFSSGPLVAASKDKSYRCNEIMFSMRARCSVDWEAGAYYIQN